MQSDVVKKLPCGSAGLQLAITTLAHHVKIFCGSRSQAAQSVKLMLSDLGVVLNERTLLLHRIRHHTVDGNVIGVI